LASTSSDNIAKLLESYPFLTYLIYGGNEYIGIVQNSDDQITTIYDYGRLRTYNDKVAFLELAEQWWWESNRLIPINVFLKQEWEPFKPCIATMNSKDVDVRHGPATSLKLLASRKTKRRSITLVRRTD
jgi:hypothetical protein